MAFWVYASPDTISAGEEAAIILNIENTNDHDVDIDLPSRCGMVWWIEDSDGERVFPREGDECGVNARMGSLTSTDRWGVWHLFPQQSFKFDYTWAGMRWTQGGLVPAEPGTYTLVGSIGREAESMARATSRVTVR